MIDMGREDYLYGNLDQTIPADDLAPCVARPSAGMLLTAYTQYTVSSLSHCADENVFK